MMGYIMKKRQTAMGIETTGASPTYMANPSRNIAKPGAILPSIIPPIMLSKTHTVRYFSNKLSPLDSFVMHVSVFIYSLILADYSGFAAVIDILTMKSAIRVPCFIIAASGYFIVFVR